MHLPPDAKHVADGGMNSFLRALNLGIWVCWSESLSSSWGASDLSLITASHRRLRSLGDALVQRLHLQMRSLEPREVGPSLIHFSVRL